MARAGGITNAVNVGIAVQADWENREFISHISLNVRQLFDFLVQFGISSLVFSSYIRDSDLYDEFVSKIVGSVLFISLFYLNWQLDDADNERSSVCVNYVVRL
ncbi:putative protein BRICK1 [Helianthus anomalus]